MGAENYNLLNSLPLENCVLLGYCAQSSGNAIRTFRGNLSFPYVSQVIQDKVSQNTTILLHGGSQVNDMFRPLLIRLSSGQT